MEGIRIETPLGIETKGEISGEIRSFKWRNFPRPL
jgi:hypothetical protein